MRMHACQLSNANAESVLECRQACNANNEFDGLNFNGMAFDGMDNNGFNGMNFYGDTNAADDAKSPPAQGTLQMHQDQH